MIKIYLDITAIYLRGDFKDGGTEFIWGQLLDHSKRRSVVILVKSPGMMRVTNHHQHLLSNGMVTGASSDDPRYCGGGVWRTLSLRKWSIITTKIGKIKPNLKINFKFDGMLYL